MNVLLRILLIRRPLWQRRSLLASYLVCLQFLIMLGILLSFSPPEPFSYPEWNDRMDRAMMIPSLFGVVILGVALIEWLLACFSIAIRFHRRERGSLAGLLFFFPAPVAFVVLGRLYGALLTGEAREFHLFLYRIFGHVHYG